MSLNFTLKVGALERYADSAIHNLLRAQRDELSAFCCWLSRIARATDGANRARRASRRVTRTIAQNPALERNHYELRMEDWTAPN